MDTTGKKAELVEELESCSVVYGAGAWQAAATTQTASKWFPRFWEACRRIFFELPPTTTTTTQTWTSLKSAQQSSATPRCLRAGARGRRAGGASSWLSCDAARATFSSCLTPGRCSARASSMVEAAALRSAAAPLGSWRDRSAPSASALSRVGELAGRRTTRQ